MVCNDSTTNSSDVSSSDTCGGDDSYETQNGIIRIRITLYVVCLVLGLCGNALVVLVSIRYWRYMNCCRLLMSHLALTDAIFVLRLPMQIKLELTKSHWSYGLVTCKLLHGVTSASGYASVATIAVIAIERYRAVMSPVAHRWSIRHLVVIIVVVWTLSFIVYAPYLYALGVYDDYCYDRYSSKTFLHIYTVALFTVKFVFPLLAIGYCYTRVVIRLRQRSVSNFARSSISHAERRIRSTRKIIKTLLTVVVAFAICTLPASIWWLWYDFSDDKEHSAASLDILEVFAALVYLHAGINPIIYAVMDRQFRLDVRALLCPSSDKLKQHNRRISVISFKEPRRESRSNVSTVC